MNSKISLALSCLAAICPIIAIIINIFLEPEIAEAILGGLIIGGVSGSILGSIALILNKGKNRLVKILSIVPMIPVGIYVLLAVPYFLHG